MGETGTDGERFIDNKRITGAIPDMLEDAVEFVRTNSRTKTIIDDNGKRVDKTEYPVKAVREAILYALVHRDYSIYTENTPIRIINVLEGRKTNAVAIRKVTDNRNWKIWFSKQQSTTFYSRR